MPTRLKTLEINPRLLKYYRDKYGLNAEQAIERCLESKKKREQNAIQ